MQLQNFDEVRRMLASQGRLMAYCQLFQRVSVPGKTNAEASQILARWNVPAEKVVQPDEGTEDGGGGDGGDGTEDAEATTDTNGAGKSEKGAPPWLDECLLWLKHRAGMFVAQANAPIKFQLKCFRGGAQYLTSVHFIGAPTPGENGAPTELQSSMDALLHMESEIPGMGGDTRVGVDPALFPPVAEVEGMAALQYLELTGTVGSFVHKLVMPTVRVMLYQVLSVNRSQGVLIEQQRRVIASQDERVRELTFEVRAYEAADSTDRRTKVQRTQLVGKVMDELGQVSRAWIAAKTGIPPEMMPLLELVAADADLKKVLSSPDVHAFLKDDAERAELVTFLTGVAKVHAARRKQKEQEAAGSSSSEKQDEDATQKPGDTGGIDAPLP